MLMHGNQETLNARSEYVTSQDDGSAEHRINQYVIKQEIGRGSFGAVHIALDQYGREYVRTILPHQIHCMKLMYYRLSRNSPRPVCVSGNNLISFEDLLTRGRGVRCKGSTLLCTEEPMNQAHQPENPRLN